MAVALHGNLRDFGIGEVFQLIGHQRKTGVLEVTAGGARVRIGFDHGAVVAAETVGPYDGFAVADMLVRSGHLTRERHAALEAEIDEGGDLRVGLEADLGESLVQDVADLVTRETLFDLLQRQQGSFHFTPGPVHHGREASGLLPAEQILMDGLRMVDEWRTLDPAATRGDTVFRRSGDFSEFRVAQDHQSPEQLIVAERLFLLVDGRLPVRRVVDLSRLGTFEASRWLSAMRESGILETVTVSTGASASGPRVAPRSSPAGWIVAALPFLLLVAVAAAAIVRTPHPTSRAPFAADPMLRALDAAGELRLRNSIEAHRFLEGQLPGSLGELPPSALPPPPMAAVAPRPYYFDTKGGRYVLLPPAN